MLLLSRRRLLPRRVWGRKCQQIERQLKHNNIFSLKVQAGDLTSHVDRNNLHSPLVERHVVIPYGSGVWSGRFVSCICTDKGQAHINLFVGSY